MESLLQLDQDIFLTVNGFHRPWLDELMFWISNKYVWIPVYVLLLGALLRMLGWKKTLLVAGMAGLAILLADQTASGLLKPWVERPRPCHDLLLAGKVHLVNGKCGGPFGFASSHAANFFALATLMSIVFVGKGRKWSILFFAAASLVAYSRVYLGVHFPGDVVAGAVIGMVWGSLTGLFWRRLSARLFHES